MGDMTTGSALNIAGILKACAKENDLGKGSKLHAYIREQKFLENNCYVASALVSMYARCGSLAQAQQVLSELPVRDVVTWNALIAAYVQQGQSEEALKCFDNMQGEGHSPTIVTFICALKACGSIGAAAKGEQIHEKIVSLCMLEKDIVLGSSLVDMYAKCGKLDKAQKVLLELPVRDVVTWTALIAGYTQQGNGKEALTCFDDMLHEGHSPDAVTFICALKACGNIGAIARGEQIHDKVSNLGLLKGDIVLGNILIDMYARCGALLKAQQVLRELPARNMITWNTLITGYSQQGKGDDALKCFDSMRQEGYSPNAVSFICALKACGSIGAVAKGEEIHKIIVSLGLLEKDIALGNILIDMYARCGALAKAQDVVNNLLVRNVVTWNVLIAVYAQQAQGEEALKCFDSMQHEGVWPDALTFVSVLKACGNLGAATKGEQIHDKIKNLGILEKDIALGNTLVDMYASCGTLSKAEEVLKKLPVQNVVTWSALIGGHAQQGHSEEALSCFEKMQAQGISPDAASLVCVLNACSHSGQLDQAEVYFLRMSTEYAITPSVEHYCCMVDLFGCAGRFNEALVVIGKMPSADHLPVWLALLGACSKWGDVNIGRVVFKCALCLDRNDASVYVCMVNIYTAAAMQEDADKIKEMRMTNEA